MRHTFSKKERVIICLTSVNAKTLSLLESLESLVLRFLLNTPPRGETPRNEKTHPGAHVLKEQRYWWHYDDMKMRFCCAHLGLLLLCIPFCSRGRQQQQKQLLIVLVHGMGDTCCNPLSLGKIESLIESSSNETRSGQILWMFINVERFRKRYFTKEWKW